MLSKIKRLFALEAHASRSTVNDPLQKFKFRLTIPGLPAGIGFQKVSGLSLEVGVTEYEESGFEYTHKLAGRPKVPEVTAERGVYADLDLKDIIKDTLTNPNMRKTLIFEQLDRFGNVIHTYKLAEAWVSKWEGSDFDSTSDDVAIDKLTIQFESYID